MTVWFFLMASAHGPGFMVLPFVMAMPADVLAGGTDACETRCCEYDVPVHRRGCLAIHMCAYPATTAHGLVVLLN